MDDAMKARLSDVSIWIRGLYMLLFVIAYNVAEILLTVIVIFQFFATLITGQPNESLRRFGGNLSAYFYQVINFLTFNDEAHPYPFSDWPDAPTTDTPWTGGGQDTTPAEAPQPPAAANPPERLNDSEKPDDAAPRI